MIIGVDPATLRFELNDADAQFEARACDAALLKTAKQVLQ
jgi:hypothetical protein